MEHTDKKITGQEIRSIIFLILLAIAIAALIVAIAAIIKYGKEIKSNPIEYGIEKYEIDFCTCLKEGQSQTFFYPNDSNLNNINGPGRST